MSFVAPFSSYMRLGQGFNSYTQEVCIEDAVIIAPRASSTQKNKLPDDPNAPLSTTVDAAKNLPVVNIGADATSPAVPGSTTPAPLDGPKVNGVNEDSGAAPVPDVKKDQKSSELMTSTSGGQPDQQALTGGKELCQTVTYSSRRADNISDIISTLNISASSSIKYGTVTAGGSASFVNENKISAADVNYVLSTKVINAAPITPDSMTFNPMNIHPSNFTEVYGDCFISGFIEGGEFASIISIKANNKSDISSIKSAIEAHIAIPAVPGMRAGGDAGFGKSNLDIMSECEVTISVNWRGGGDVGKNVEKWDLDSVMAVARKFPAMVESCAERTSAILTRYTSLRSFVEANARFGKDPSGKSLGYLIKNYDLAQFLTMDLLSAYTAYKVLWVKLSTVMQHARAFEPALVPDAIQINPKSLNEARLLVRQQMTIIAKESARLVTNPEIADCDENGNFAPVKYLWPGLLAMRIPNRIELEEQDDSEGPSPSSDEKAVIGKWLGKVHFNDLVGDPLPEKTPWFGGGKCTLFCSLTQNPDPKKIDPWTQVRLHAHEHHHFDLFPDFKSYSKKSQASLSAICYSTARDAKIQARPDGTHRVLGRPNANQSFYSQLSADLNMRPVAEVVIEWFPKSGRIASVTLNDRNQLEIITWKQYGLKISKPEGLLSKSLQPPSGAGAWQLCGFWGYANSLVVARIAPIWMLVPADGGRGKMTTPEVEVDVDDVETNGSAA